MFGRMDTTSATCPDCGGSGNDPKKRKRPCPRCDGQGTVSRCTSCGHLMPCPGTDLKGFDQTYCDKPDPVVVAQRDVARKARTMLVTCTDVAQFAEAIVGMSTRFMAGGMDEATYAINFDNANEALQRHMDGSPDVEPCACGEMAAVWSSTLHGVRRWRVECSNCDARGPDCHERREAVMLWNDEFGKRDDE